MTAVHVGPAVPFGFDSGLPESDFEQLLLIEDMSASQFQGMLQEREFMKIESPDGSFYSYLASEAAKSPGRHSGQRSSVGASSALSPGSASMILTPTSTSDESNGDDATFGDYDGAERMPTSPSGNISPSLDASEQPRHFDGQLGGAHSTSTRPPLSSGSGARSSSLHSPASSIAPSLSPNQYHWQSFGSIKSTGGWMDQSQPSQWANLQLAPAGSFNSASTAAGVDSFDDDDDVFFDGLTNYPTVGTDPYAPNLLFRPLEYVTGETRQPSHALFTSQDDAYERSIQQQPTLQAAELTPINNVGQLSVSQSFPPQRQHMFTTHHAGRHPTLGQAQAPVQTPAPAPAYGPGLHPLAIPGYHQSGTQHLDSLSPGPVVQSARRLEPATSSSSRIASAHAKLTGKRRGGRQKNSHLEKFARDKTSKMRKAGACWRCALQRDPVSQGPGCSVARTMLMIASVSRRKYAVCTMHRKGEERSDPIL